METWYIWVIIALLLFIAEIFTSGFAVLCLSVGALVGAVAAAYNCELEVQILWFALATFISFISIRPLILKYLRPKHRSIRTNADALIGRIAIVTEEIDNESNRGRVKIDGDDWKAIAGDGNLIESGSKVTVTDRNSIILTVKRK